MPHTASIADDQPLLKHIPKAGDNTSAATVNQKMHTEQSIALGAHTSEMPPAPLAKVHNAALRTAKRTSRRCQRESDALSVTLPVSFRAVSRPLELSLQSTFQLSLTVLVCYRFRGRI